jgi:hypothetical protein
MRSTTPLLLQAIHGEIMQYRVEPRPHGIAAALPPSGDGVLQAVLHQIVSRRRIVQQRTGIATQAGNQRLQQINEVVQRALLETGYRLDIPAAILFQALKIRPDPVSSWLHAVQQLARGDDLEEILP